MSLIASTAIGVGGSLLGGLLGARNAKVPDSLNNQISALQNPDYYAPLLQRIISANQGYSNINRSLNRQGVSANANLMDEINQDQQSQSQEQITQTMRGLEGQRMGALGQLENTKLGYKGLRAGAIDAGITGGVTSLLNYGFMSQSNRDLKALLAEGGK